MKKLLTILIIMTASLSLSAQSFHLKFATFEEYLTQNFSPEKVKTAIAPNYLLVKQDETEWKFRDDSKNWEATIYVKFDKTTNKVKEIQFVAPKARVFEYLDELEKTLGYEFVETVGQMDIFENKTKNLGAKLLPASSLGQGMFLYCIYHL